MALPCLSIVKKWHTKKNSAVFKAHTASVRFPRRTEHRRINRQNRTGSSVGPALICDAIEDWLHPECLNYRAMYVPRVQTWGDIQPHIDAIAESGAFGEDLSVEDEIKTSTGWASEWRFATELTQKARRLVGRAIRAGLPAEVGHVIEDDFKQIGMVLAQMVPGAKMKIILDIMGENGCKRWHQDWYTGRAVVSYNSCGTDFVDHKYVDLWELNHCGNNDCIIRDKSQVCAANVGDVLFMKGTTYPSVEFNGLVHRSPEKRLHANGKVMNRLLLKVDLL